MCSGHSCYQSSKNHQTPQDDVVEHQRKDQLGRLEFVDHCCDVLKLLPCERGAVMGIAAPWGTGKTWVLEAMRDKRCQEDVWIDFNPWQFSGTDQFIEQLLNEIGQQFLITKVKKAVDKAKEIGESVLRYQQVIGKLKEHTGIIKVISPRLADLLDYLPEPGESDSKGADKKTDQATKVSLRESKDKVVQLLSGISFKVVVAIDDLDRMPPHEVAAVIQAIKAVANFPNVIYVLAYDANVVGKALQTHLRIDDGRAFLEKIVNYELVMPTPLEHKFLGALQEGVRKAFREEGKDLPNLAQADWSLALNTCAGLLSTPRDLERLMIRYQLAVRKLARSIDAKDLLIAEALQLKHPNIIGAVAQIRGQLLIPSDPLVATERPEEPPLDKALNVPGYELPSVRRALQFLFQRMLVDGVPRPSRAVDHQGLEEEALWIRWWQWAREEDWVARSDLLNATSTVEDFLHCRWFDNPQWVLGAFQHSLAVQDQERHLDALCVMALAYAQAGMDDRFHTVRDALPIDMGPFLRRVLRDAPAESLSTLLAFLVTCLPEGTVAELLGVGSGVVLDEGIQGSASRLLMEKINLGIRSESPDLPVLRRFELLAAMKKMKGRVLFEAWLNALHEDASQKPALQKVWLACLEHSALALGDKAVMSFLERFRVQDSMGLA
jgi:hypothetical protein